MFGGSFSLGMGGIPWVIMSEVDILLQCVYGLRSTHQIRLQFFVVSDISNKCERSSRKHGDSGELVGFMDHYILFQLFSAVELSRSVSILLYGLRCSMKEKS